MTQFYQSEKEELEFYRSLHTNMNGCIYILNHSPYRVEWITESKMLTRATGMSAEQIAQIGDQIPYWLSNNEALRENIQEPLKMYETNPNATIGGTYKLKILKGEAYWVGYTVSVLQRGVRVSDNKYVVMAWLMDDITHTKDSLDQYIHELSAHNHVDLREGLTERQKHILIRISEGLSMRQIAEELHLSPYTVEDYKRNLYKKLNCANQKELAVKAKTIGL